MPNRTERIMVRMTPRKKEKFEEYLEETGEYPSLSQLLRASANEKVEGRMRGGEGASIDAEEVTNAVEIAIGDVTERLERIEQEVARVDTAVQPDEEDIDTLADDIAVQLPVMDSGDGFKPGNDVLREATHGDVDGIDYARDISTVGAWSDYVDADANKTRRALSRAASWYPDVKWVHDDDLGERRYFRISEAE
ncbi:hypothetical protein [Haloarchaeobius litoreus]|uniref:Ribbon-helix-helix protein, copG family n=1 Tax=Haloarchaeobius litoreus TaxID=755306 RepID=A0ABD6DMM9_9EURY|nr:hypothetical protein [Haloarchaeobius litoreus]